MNAGTSIGLAAFLMLAANLPDEAIIVEAPAAGCPESPSVVAGGSFRYPVRWQVHKTLLSHQLELAETNNRLSNDGAPPLYLI